MAKDETARNEALMAFYPMIGRIAHRAAATYGLPPSVDANDLASCGAIALTEMWERFDRRRNVPFEAFAVRRVKGAVIDAIRAADWVPRKARQRARLTGDRAALLVSLDEDRSPDGDNISLADRLADADAPEPGDALIQADGRQELFGQLNGLPERERKIVMMHYFDGVLLKDIAYRFGMHPTRVSQLHTRALRRMRDGLDALDTQTAA